MFTKRIIPCLDVNNGRVVKGVNFVDLKDAGDPVEIAKAYDAAGADEVVFLTLQPPASSVTLWWIWCARWRLMCLFLLQSAAAFVLLMTSRGFFGRAQTRFP